MARTVTKKCIGCYLPNNLYVECFEHIKDPTLLLSRLSLSQKVASKSHTPLFSKAANNHIPFLYSPFSITSCSNLVVEKTHRTISICQEKLEVASMFHAMRLLIIWTDFSKQLQCHENHLPARVTFHAASWPNAIVSWLQCFSSTLILCLNFLTRLVSNLTLTKVATTILHCRQLGF